MIPNFQLSICGRLTVCQYYDKQVTHHIAIGLPEEGNTYRLASNPKRWDLQFDDILNEPNEPDGFRYPSKEDALYIIYYIADYIRLDLQAPVHLLINCQAGVSRSTATAYIILNVLSGPGREQECLDEMLKVRDCAVPNVLLIKYADELLGRNGKMLKVVVDYIETLELT